MVAARRRHHVPGIGQPEQPRAVGDGLAGEAVGVALAVPSLVMAAHPRHLVAAEHVHHHVRADLGVALDLPVLGAGERARLEQDAVLDPDLADVVHQPGLAQAHQALGPPPEGSAEGDGEVGDALGVLQGERVLGIHGAGQHADALQRLEPVQPIRAVLGRELLDDRRRVEERHVATVLLGPVQRALRETHEVGRRRRLGGVADARRHGHAARHPERGARDGLAGRVHRLPRLLRADARHEPRDLLTADARHEVGVAGEMAQVRAHRHQHAVTCVVAVFLVDLAEAVDVDQRQRQHAVAGARLADLPGQALLERPVVGEAGQRIGDPVGTGGRVEPRVGQRHRGHPGQALDGRPVAGAEPPRPAVGQEQRAEQHGAAAPGRGGVLEPDADHRPGVEAAGRAGRDLELAGDVLDDHRRIGAGRRARATPACAPGSAHGRTR